VERAISIKHIGSENVLPHIEATLQRGREIKTGFDGAGLSAHVAIGFVSDSLWTPAS
jgi:hypothetical protein